MNNTIDILQKPIKWSSTGFLFIPFKTTYLGDKYFITENDFPENAFYTLFKNEKPIYDFNNWLDNWEKPSIFNTIISICKNLLLFKNIFKILDASQT